MLRSLADSFRKCTTAQKAGIIAGSFVLNPFLPVLLGAKLAFDARRDKAPKTKKAEPPGREKSNEMVENAAVIAGSFLVNPFLPAVLGVKLAYDTLKKRKRNSVGKKPASLAANKRIERAVPEQAMGDRSELGRSLLDSDSDSEGEIEVEFEGKAEAEAEAAAVGDAECLRDLRPESRPDSV
jgi:hypothetical protein